MNKEFFKNIPPGTKLFNQFFLLDILHAGDFHGIFKCIAISGPQKGELFSLKVTESMTSREFSQEQLIREIKILSKISHSNVIKAYDWFEDDIFMAFSMEYIDGGTLADRLKATTSLPIGLAMNLLKQLALAMREIHRSGIIHRDIKPENILVTSDNILKLADFGISVRANSDKYFIPAQLSGTIDFVSPEYIHRGIYDERSDIYAWGVVAYLALTGHVPFDDELIIDALARKVTDNPHSPRRYRIDLPREISNIILKAIARDPKERFQSCEALLIELELASAYCEYIDKSDCLEKEQERFAIS